MDEAQPLAEAVALQCDRIVAVGTNAEIRALAGRDTRVIDAGQGSVVPGFNDAHVHFLAGGFSLANVNLRQATSTQDMARRLAEYVSRVPSGRWVLGGDWDHESWRDQNSAGAVAALPTRWTIDSVTVENPVLLTRMDGHMALANSPALKLAGVSKATEDPPGGLIARDPKTGEPTGILKTPLKCWSNASFLKKRTMRNAPPHKRRPTMRRAWALPA